MHQKVEPQESWQQECWKIAVWAKSIGLSVHEVNSKNNLEINFDSFLPNVWITQGIVYYNSLTHPGDLLHELGHVAVTPSWLRSDLKGNLDWEENPELWQVVSQKIDNLSESEWNFVVHGDEQAAIAWSFAAAQAADVDDFLPFETGFEDGGVFAGEALHESLVISSLTGRCCHPGIACLFHGKILDNKKAFPNLNKWIQI